MVSGLPFDLTRPAPPWVVFAPSGDATVARQVAALRARGGVVRALDARDMPTPAAVFRAFAAALDLPDWFGHNWDALADSLGYLDGDRFGTAGVAVLVDRAEALLTAGFLPLLAEVLGDAAGRAEEVPVHVVFLVDPGDPGYPELARLVASPGGTITIVPLPRA